MKMGTERFPKNIVLAQEKYADVFRKAEKPPWEVEGKDAERVGPNRFDMRLA